MGLTTTPTLPGQPRNTYYYVASHLHWFLPLACTLVIPLSTISRYGGVRIRHVAANNIVFNNALGGAAAVGEQWA